MMEAMRTVLLCGCLLVGCASEPVDQAETFEIQPRLSTPRDILVVLDDTPAMGTHLPGPDPANVAAVLTGIYNGAPDLRIAVTTGTTGTLRTSPAVPTGVIEHRVDFADGELKTSYGGTLTSALSSLMNVGTSSTSASTVLASTEQALASGFSVRPSAALGILVVAANADASPGDAASYAEAIRARPNDVMLSWVSPDAEPRLDAFADGFAHRYFTPIDAYGMEAISAFAELFQDGPVDGCFPIDAASNCELYTSYDHVVNRLPACSGSPWESATACWQLQSDSACASGRAILFGGPFTVYHPHVIGRCFH